MDKRHWNYTLARFIAIIIILLGMLLIMFKLQDDMTTVNLSYNLKQHGNVLDLNGKPADFTFSQREISADSKYETNELEIMEYKLVINGKVHKYHGESLITQFLEAEEYSLVKDFCTITDEKINVNIPNDSRLHIFINEGGIFSFVTLGMCLVIFAIGSLFLIASLKYISHLERLDTKF